MKRARRGQLDEANGYQVESHTRLTVQSLVGVDRFQTQEVQPCGQWARPLDYLTLLRLHDDWSVVVDVVDVYYYLGYRHVTRDRGVTGRDSEMERGLEFTVQGALGSDDAGFSVD